MKDSQEFTVLYQLQPSNLWAGYICVLATMALINDSVTTPVETIAVYGLEGEEIELFAKAHRLSLQRWPR